VKLGDVEYSTHQGAVIARLTGEVDLSNAESIGGALAEATPNRSLALVLDLSGVEYLDSAGIRMIFQLRGKLRARGQALWLVVPLPSAANDTLRLAGVQRHIKTIETVDDALRNLQ